MPNFDLARLDAVLGRSAVYVSTKAYGIKADFTGTRATAGTGTDDRAAIQAWLDAHATYAVGGVLGRFSVVARLPPGHYRVGARPDGTASLVVPKGVVFDFSGCSLAFEYPAAATTEFCAIKVQDLSGLAVGRLFARAGSAPPSALWVYDAVRVVDTDSKTLVTGALGEGEIVAPRGCGVRSVGAWNVTAHRISVYEAAIGFATGRFGPGLSKAGRSRTDDYAGNVSTWHRYVDCHAVNVQRGFLAGLGHGAGAAFNAFHAEGHNGPFDLYDGCSVENCPDLAVAAYGNPMVTAYGLILEESGRPGGNVVELACAASALFAGCRMYLNGRPLTLKSETALSETTTLAGAVRVFGGSVVTAAGAVGTATLKADGFNVQNSLVNNLALWDGVGAFVHDGTYAPVLDPTGCPVPLVLPAAAEAPLFWRSGSVVHALGSFAAGETKTFAVTVPGATNGSVAAPVPPAGLHADFRATAAGTAADTVTVSVTHTGTFAGLFAGTHTWGARALVAR